MSTPGLTVSDRIRQVLDETGLTIDAFAQQLGEKPQRIKDVLRGKQRAPEAMLAALATRPGVDIAYVLTGQPGALRRALEDVSLSSTIAERLGATPQEKSEIQDRVFAHLSKSRLSTEEQQLIDYYRIAGVAGRAAIMAAAETISSRVLDDPKANKG